MTARCDFLSGATLLKYSVLLSAMGCAACAATTTSSGSSARSGAATTSSALATRAVATKAVAGPATITFGVTSRSGRLGAVQFDARAAGISWAGAGKSVACRNISGAAMHACNDKGGGLLTCAVIDPKGFGSPTNLVSCDLESAGGVDASAFSIKVIDASDAKANAASVTVGVTNLTGR